MPWMQDRGWGPFWYQKGKSRIENKEGYETLSLEEGQYQLIVDYMMKNNLVVGKSLTKPFYWHFSNNEEVEINPKNKSITFKKNSARRSVRTRLENIIEIEQVESGH